MVGLNKIDSSAGYPVDPASSKRAETSEHGQILKLFDGHVLPEGAKLSDHSFVRCSSEIASNEQVDIAYGILDKLLGDVGELQMVSHSEISHTKSGIAVPVTLSNYIHQGVFSLEPFIESVKKDLQEKSAVFARMGEVCSVKVKADYPKSFNLSLWFTTKCFH